MCLAHNLPQRARPSIADADKKESMRKLVRIHEAVSPIGCICRYGPTMLILRPIQVNDETLFRRIKLDVPTPRLTALFRPSLYQKLLGHGCQSNRRVHPGSANLQLPPYLLHYGVSHFLNASDVREIRILPLK